MGLGLGLGLGLGFGLGSAAASFLPKRLLLLLRTVFALPKASRSGLVERMASESALSLPEMWGDMGRCGEMCGDMGRCGELACGLAAERFGAEGEVTHEVLHSLHVDFARIGLNLAQL